MLHLEIQSSNQVRKTVCCLISCSFNIKRFFMVQVLTAGSFFPWKVVQQLTALPLPNAPTILLNYCHTLVCQHWDRVTSDTSPSHSTFGEWKFWWVEESAQGKWIWESDSRDSGVCCWHFFLGGRAQRMVHGATHDHCFSGTACHMPKLELESIIQLASLRLKSLP